MAEIEVTIQQCPKCGQRQQDTGVHATCKRCGHVPMPSQQYGRGSPYYNEGKREKVQL